MSSEPSPARRGRPPTGRALPAAERARRYRARLRARGVRLTRVRKQDPLLAGLKFSTDSYLTPGERDVLRRFCQRLHLLPRMPERIAVFGSRARGDSHAHSDLDVAVFFDCERDREMESKLSGIAYEARKHYSIDGYGIALRPVALFRSESPALLRAIREDLETLWTRP